MMSTPCRPYRGSTASLTRATSSRIQSRQQQKPPDESKSHHKLILTGTPVQNNVNELWAVFDFLMPNFLGTEAAFTKSFAKPIINGQVAGASPAAISLGMNKLKLLHQTVLPFILRREKQDVMKELPPKVITDIPCVLSQEQAALYRQFHC